MGGPSNQLRIEILLARAGEGHGFLAKVYDSPVGQTPHQELHPSLEEAEGLLEGLGVPEVLEKDARRVGEALFRALFHSEIYTCLRRSLDAAAGRTLQIRLRFSEVPELEALPWELLYDPRHNTFLARGDENTTLVRFVETEDPQPNGPEKLPIRILAVLAHASGDPEAGFAEEKQKLQQTISQLASRLEIEWLQPPTFDALQTRLREKQYHVFHFIGHGCFDDTGLGDLLFVSQDGGRDAVDSQRLGAVLRQHKSLGLVFLNTCLGGKVSLGHPFGGIAQNLVRVGVPAVVAMQSQVTDRVAASFGHELYRHLRRQKPLDLAVAEARKAVYQKVRHNSAWASPVLYARTDLFQPVGPRWKKWLTVAAGALALLLGGSALDDLLLPSAGCRAEALVLNRQGEDAYRNARPDLAQAAFRKALQADEDCARVHNNLAVALLDLGQVKQAVEHARRAAGLEPDSIDAYFTLATAYRVQGRFQQAVDALEQLLTISPDNPEAHNELTLMHIDVGQYDRAVVTARQGLQAAPHFQWLRKNLAQALLQKGECQEALEAAQATSFKVDEWPEWTEILYIQAEAYQALGKSSDACNAIAEAQAWDKKRQTGWWPKLGEVARQAGCPLQERTSE